jgi:purine nucleosidase
LTKTLTVYTDDPVASFVYSPDRSKIGKSISFNASSSFDPNGNIENYAWDFGDGSTGNGVEIKHSYASAGEYSATLTITDSEGKTVKETRLVTVITGVPKKVIYETDMCLDVDDVGALAVLHAMANNSEVELLAVCFNEVHPSGASAIDAINTWYGRGDIPVGVYKGDLHKPDKSKYLKHVAKFPHDLENTNAADALNVYRDVLAQQADSSVTIISVGFLNNLNDLLLAEPELIAKKVRKLVIMAGLNNDKFNLVRHNLSSVSEYVFDNWPTPLVLSYEGGSIFTGDDLKHTPEENPVREAFYRYFGKKFRGRSSWDEMAVLYGVRGLRSYFDEVTSGSGSFPTVYTWQMNPECRSFIKASLHLESYEKIIQGLMLEPPIR